MANNVPPPLDRAQAARDMADGKLTEQELRDMGYRNTVINIVKAEAEKINQRASEPEQVDDGPVATSDVDQFDSLLGEDGPDKPAPTGPEVFAGQDVDDMGVYDHLLGEDEDSQDNNNQDNNNQDNSNQDNGSQQDDYQVTPTPPGPVEPDGPLSPGDSLTFDVTTPSGAVMSSGHKTGEEADEKIDQINMMRSALQAANRSLDEVKPGATSDPSLAPSLAEALIEKAGRVKGTLTNDRFLDYALSANGKRELATLTYALLGMKKPARPRKKKPTAQTALNFDAPADNSFVPKEEEEQAQVLKPELPKNAIESLLDEIDELWEEDQVVEVGANNPAEVLQNPAENRNFEEQGPAVDAHGVPVFQSEAEAMDLFAKLAACHKKN
jgi:flagellum-specific peptidoglycan hydrolase FlgJ